MLMFNLLRRKDFNTLTSKILNSKKTYILLVVIILIQFLLVGIIFLQNKKSKYIIEQTNFRAATIENQQKQLSTQMNGIQSNLMRMASQLYRLQGGSSDQ